MLITGRNKRYVDLAKRLALTSDQHHKHAAILVKGGSVISWSNNRNKFKQWAQKFRARHRGPATIHAEIGAVLGVSREKTNGSDLYVVRVNHKGNLCLSIPCNMCHEVLSHVGVKRVYYSVDNQTIGCYKVSGGVNEARFNHRCT